MFKNVAIMPFVIDWVTDFFSNGVFVQIMLEILVYKFFLFLAFLVRETW